MKKHSGKNEKQKLDQEIVEKIGAVQTREVATEKVRLE